MPSSAAKPAKVVIPRRKRVKAKGPGWSRHALWPFLICLALDPFLVRAASILALEGPRPFTMLYPWVEFLYLPAFHLTAETVGTLQQWVLYLQYPVYGLVMMFAYRADKRFRALNYGLALHFGGVLLVELFSYYGR